MTTMAPPAHFDTMSMKDLRTELDAIGADYTNCVEKNDLAKMLSVLRHKTDKEVSAHMSMKEMKEKLRTMGVDFTGCLEKSELKALLMKSTQERSSDAAPMLSIREIKERLGELGVDYSQCLEMTELIELLVAKEQGHSTNPFRAKENETSLAKEKSNDSLGDSLNSSRGERKTGLKDITRTEGNNQHPKQEGAKIEKPMKPVRSASDKSLKKTKAKASLGEAKDLEAPEKDDVQACTEYVHDVYGYFRRAEEKYMPRSGYMEAASKVETSDGKKLVNTKMRAIVVDWMIELHQRFRPSLQPAALYLGINVFDRFLASGEMKECYRLQVIGAACLLVAAKIEEIYPPKVRELKKMVDGATAPEICAAERAVLQALRFNVSNPTVFHFMKRYLKAAEADLKLKALTMYIVEVGLHDVKMMDIKPSLLASAAIHLGLAMLGRNTWTATLQTESKYEAEELKECAGQLTALLHRVQTDDTLYAVSAKFRSSKYLEVGKTTVVSV